MKPVPSDLALLALRDVGIRVRPATLRSWAHRGHIVHTRDGYDLRSLLAYIDRRASRKQSAS